MESSVSKIPGNLTDSLLSQLRNELSVQDQLWLSGYLYGLSQRSHSLQEVITSEKPIALTILFGSQTGNSKAVAKLAAEAAKTLGFEVNLLDMNSYQPKQLKQERLLIVAVSTYGEGEPPAAAETLHQFIFSTRAPKLENLEFAVIALGDKSYTQFCKTGIDFDVQLEKLGAKRILDRIDLDVDYHDDAVNWVDKLSQKLNEKTVSRSHDIPSVSNGISTQKHILYSRKHPYHATLLEKIQLNGRGSEKETWHFELSLENSGIQYEAGDALGIIPVNNDKLVQEFLNAAQIDGITPVEFANDLVPFYDVLKNQIELSLLSRDVIQKFQEKTQNEFLKAILEDAQTLQEFIYGRDVIDLLHDFPAEWTASELIGVLRPIQPRLYSIASSQSFVGEEVHLTIAAVRYESNGRQKLGTTSTWLADSVQTGDLIRVFVEKNEYFKLPQDSEKSVIMIGPGTGIAPFRAFSQELESRNSKNPAWLIFGNPHFATDFLYQLEWQRAKSSNVLSRIDLAWSQDQKDKIYVQHKLRESSKEVFSWLESGAMIYVCGDKKKMAKDVQKALFDVIRNESGKDDVFAENYIKNLKKERRYVEDVY